MLSRFGGSEYLLLIIMVIVYNCEQLFKANSIIYIVLADACKSIQEM